MSTHTHSGILISWNDKKGWGIIQDSATRYKRYFVHASNVIEGPELPEVPQSGDFVFFDVTPPRKEGQLPKAVNARIVAQKAQVTGGAQ
jgi:hypothetical protein